MTRSWTHVLSPVACERRKQSRCGALSPGVGLKPPCMLQTFASSTDQFFTIWSARAASTGLRGILQDATKTIFFPDYAPEPCRTSEIVDRRKQSEPRSRSPTPGSRDILVTKPGRPNGGRPVQDIDRPSPSPLPNSLFRLATPRDHTPVGAAAAEKKSS